MLTCFFVVANVYADKFVFKHYTTVNGLSHNEVRCLAQGDDGRIWMGTQNGLSVYDGHRIKIYKHSPLDSTSILGDKIDDVFVDSKGDVWLNTNAGLCLFNPTTEKAISWGENEQYTARLFYEDKNASLWMFSNNGNYKISDNRQNITEVFKGINLTYFYEDKKGNLWLGNQGQLSVYNAALESLKTISLSGIGHVVKVFHQPLGVKIVVGSSGIVKINRDGIQTKLSKGKVDYRDFACNSCVLYQSQYLVMGSYGGGVVVYNIRTHQVETFKQNPQSANGISSNDVYAIHKTKDNILLLGTQEGLDIYDPLQHQFLNIVHDPSDNNSISHHFVQAITQVTTGDIWLGTRAKGVDKLSVLSNEPFEYQVKHLCMGNANDIHLQSNHVMRIFEDSKGRLWIATWGGGLTLYDRDRGSYRTFRANPNDDKSLPSDIVTSILEDSYGYMWVGTTGGLALINEEDEDISFQVFKKGRYQPKTLNLNNIFALYEDSRKRFWVGINGGGLNLMHREGDEIWFEHFVHNASDPHSLSNDEVFVIFEDDKANLWVGTSGAGFNRLIETPQANGSNKISFVAFTEQDGLADNEVNSILQDNQGDLWLATNKGITLFNPQSEEMINYGTYDGVLKGKYRKNAGIYDEDGYIWFGGAAGISRFRPEDIKSKADEASVFISDIIVDGHKIRCQQLNNTSDKIQAQKQISVEWPFDRMQVWVHSNRISASERLSYSYQLGGGDNNWLTTEANQSMLDCSSLWPGKYKLRVNVNKYGRQINKNTATLLVSVTIPSWVFVTSGILLVLILLVLFRKPFRKLVSGLQSSKKITSATLGSVNDDALKNQIIALMEQDKLFLNAHLTAFDLADAAEISYPELANLLKNELNQTYTDFINHYRVEEVKIQLVDSGNAEKSIIEIAWQCGFNSKSAFNRIFKSSTGQTPTQFRQACQK